MADAAARILLVSHHSDDATLVRDLLHRAGNVSTRVDWIRLSGSVLQYLTHAQHDLLLVRVDRSVAQEAMALLQALQSHEPAMPIPALAIVDDIDPAISRELIEAGAAECLDGRQLNAEVLRLGIQYAFYRQRSAAQRAELAHLHRALIDIEAAAGSAEQRERRYHMALQHVPLLFYINDRSLRYTWVQCLHGHCTQTDMLGKRDEDLLVPEDAAKLVRLKHAVIETGIGTRQEMWFSLGDTARCYDLIIKPLFGEQDEVGGLFVVAFEITVYKRAEQELSRYCDRLEQIVLQRTEEVSQLRQRLRLSEHMVSLGTLSAGIGHDMGNLLLPIRLRLDSLESKPLPDDVRDDLEAIRKAADYLQKLSSGMRLFALDPMDESASEEHVDVAAWWRDAEPFFRHVLPRSVQLESRHAAQPFRVKIPKHRLTQAIFNLVQNAGEAMRDQDAGTVVIWFEPGTDPQMARIGVSDDGPGMTPDILERCMEPFFTTKTGSTTGLGLALVRDIVQKAGGVIEVQSEPNRGSTFVLTLPAVIEQARSQTGAAAVAPRRAIVCVRHARIRAFVTAVLESFSFEILQADRILEHEAMLLVAYAHDIALEDIHMFLDRGNRRALVIGGPTDGPSIPALIRCDEPASTASLLQTLHRVVAELDIAEPS